MFQKNNFYTNTGETVGKISETINIPFVHVAKENITGAIKTVVAVLLSIKWRYELWTPIELLSHGIAAIV